MGSNLEQGKIEVMLSMMSGIVYKNILKTLYLYLSS